MRLPATQALAMAMAMTLALAAGCAHRPPPPAPSALPAPAAAELPPPDRIPGDLTLRQKLTATSAHGGGSFETILQKRPGMLRVLGLTPFGTRAFLLEQRADKVDFTRYIPHELPFPPTFMLLDIHRVFDRWLDAPPPTDGERSGIVAGQRISERWQSGRLRQRVFSSTPGASPGAVTITYDGEIAPGVAADVVLANDRFGYRLQIHNLPAAGN
ncbi:MAG TPA: DUF3261 domain-containing protein [Polyangia bacterium]|nr:DUF3261 domain-containing protein [Polyangia bacterium]